ncbi:MAG: hypothetical protein WD316_09845 [Phycisphaeraceae bacterium]
MTPIENLTLEFSLKPFAGRDPDRFTRVSERIWSLWQPAIANARQLSVQLWIGTGDEIFVFAGDPNQAFPWAESIGFCNYAHADAYDQANVHYRVNKAQPFRDDPGRFTYGDLKQLIAALRATARDRLGRELRVGATVDPGPEFADSPFRYEHHREILQPTDNPLYRPMRFISHQTRLRGDDQVYAGFPDGIPDDISLGQFLGRQFKALREYAGFDYLWLSNGFGYSENPWVWYGHLFDGHRVNVERVTDEQNTTITFWEDFRAADPEAELEVRGTNFSIGMDLATDGCSHRRLNEIGGLMKPPCNPPWGSRALGLEMGSYLSRLAKTPTRRLPFRFYLNDPWFVARPWYDYYGREPFDMYVPLSAARLGEGGAVETPTDFNMFSIDSFLGELDAEQAQAVLPHVIEAWRGRADAAGPVVWVYPFDEYHDLLDAASPELAGVFAHDWFMCRAIDEGLPVNTVCSSDRFVELARGGQLPDAVYIAPAPLGDWAYGQALLEHVQAGGRAIVYGSLAAAPPALREALGVALDEPLEGEFNVAQQRLELDEIANPDADVSADDPTYAAIGMAGSTAQAAGPAADRPVIHRAGVSGGGIREVVADAANTRTTLQLDGASRAYTVCRSVGRGTLAWHRGTVSFEPHIDRLEPGWDAPAAAQQPAQWMRSLLGELGVTIRQHKPYLSSKSTYAFIKRVGGAWVLTGHQPDTSVEISVATPDGAPAFEEYETRIVNGAARVAMGKTFHRPARVFVRMGGDGDGVVSVKLLPVNVGRAAHFSVSGLRDADVTLYPEPGALKAGRVELRESVYGEPIDGSQIALHPDKLCLNGYTGSLYIQW